MKIAILTAGTLPVPAVCGGAVENLVDFCLEYNDYNKLHEITVFSIAHPAIKNHPALRSKMNHYYYIDTTSIKAKIIRKLFYNRKDKYKYYNNLLSINKIFRIEKEKHKRKSMFSCFVQMENKNLCSAKSQVPPAKPGA